MKVEQISIFLENKTGRLAEVTQSLSDGGVNIRALSLADTSDFGILRLLVDDKEKAKEVLSRGNFTVRLTSVTAVEVPDRPGGLNDILQLLGKNSINVEYMYAFVCPNRPNAVLVFRFDKPDEAGTVLQNGGFTIVTDEEICNI